MNCEYEYDAISESDPHYKQVEMDFDRLVASIEPHPTEVKCPNQAAGFKALVDQMYQTHLDKNADYSPANILGVGEIGLIVRMWDKMTRLMNLLGFRIEVKFVEYVGPKDAKNESVDDTYLDMAVYSIISLLYRSGKWGN